jgi:hypothetical protein
VSLDPATNRLPPAVQAALSDLNETIAAAERGLATLSVHLPDPSDPDALPDAAYDALRNAETAFAAVRDRVQRIDAANPSNPAAADAGPDPTGGDPFNGPART